MSSSTQNLHEAIVAGDVQGARHILSEIPDPKLCVLFSVSGIDALALCVCYRRCVILEICLEYIRGTDLSELRYGGGNTLMHFAAVTSSAEIVRVLADAKCSADLSNQAGDTPLCVALSIPNVDTQVVWAFIDAGAELTPSDLMLMKKSSKFSVDFMDNLTDKIKRHALLKKINREDVPRDFSEPPLEQPNIILPDQIRF